MKCNNCNLDYRNPLVAEAMRVMKYVNKFNRGVTRVQEMLKENGNPPAEFDVNTITAFRVNVTVAKDEPASILTKVSNDATPGTNGTTPGTNGTTPDRILDNIPEELKVKLGKIGKKCAPAALEEIIVELCRIMPLNTEQLSELTHKSVDYLRKRIIPKLMREKRIRFTIPEMVNHPDQKYQA